MTRDGVIKTVNNLEGENGHCKALQIYNSQKTLPRGYSVRLSDPWCATFVSAVLTMNGYDKINECSCSEMITKAKSENIWVEDDNYNCRVGDVLMYDWNDNGVGDCVGEPDHVGIIIAVTDKNIVVREGNKSSSIGNRTINRNGKFIRGFIVPPYDDEPDIETKKARLIEYIDNMDFSKVTKDDIIKAIKEGL